MASFVTVIRTQYCVKTTQKGEARLLDSLYTAGISITAYVVNVKESGVTMLFVVGLPNEANPAWDAWVVQILKDGKYSYSTASVVEVTGFHSGIPGIARTMYGGLFCQVKIKSIYKGEDNSTYIYSNDSEKVVSILNQPTVPQCSR